MVLKKEISLQIKDLLQKNPQGLNITDIVKEVKINRNTAGRYLENLLVSGQVDMRRFGMAKIYMISQRVPLSAVLSVSSEIVVQLDRNLRIVYANDPFLRLIASEREDFIGKNIEFTSAAVVFEDLFSEFLENIRQGIEGKEWSGEIVLSAKKTILFCRIAPTVFEDGRKGVSIIFEDITERKKAETSLHDSEERYRTLVNISPDAVILHRNGNIIFMNPAALTLIGASQLDDMLGKNILEFIQPEFLDEVKKNIQKDLKGDISPLIELHMLRLDGSTIIVEGRGVKTTIGGKPAIQVALRDITERKRVEEMLQKSEKQYRSLVETTGTGYVILDKTGRVITANQEYVRLTGRSSLAEVERRPVTDWTASYDIERNVREIETCFTKGQVRGFEVDYQQPDGTIQPIEINASVIQSDSEPIILTLCRDITERKRSETALRESEEKYRSFINRANDVICIIQDGIIKMCNPRLSEFWGGPLEEIIGRHISGFVHPDARSTVIERYNRRMAGEKIPQIYETVLMRKDGSRSFVELNAGIISYEGKPADLVIVRDINDRKKAEQELHESAARLSLLLDSTDDLIFMQDPEGRYLYFNAAARYGLSGEKIIGSTPFDLLDKESADRIVDRVKKVVKTGQSIREETPFIWKGQSLWFSDNLSPVMNENGSISAVVTVSRNITERKTAEIALRESEATARALLNAPTDSVILIDSEGKILALNEIAASRFGKRSDELVGIMSYDLLPKEVGQLRRSLMAPVLEKREMVRFVDQRDGRWYDTVAYPILDEPGTVKKIAIIARDVTEQKNIENQLRKSEQMYKILLEQSFDAIAIHKQGKITFLNERAAKVLGAAKPEDLTGRPIFNFIHPDSRKDLEDRLKELSAAEGMSAPVITEKFIRTDGSTVTVEVMAISFDDNGVPAFRVAFREVIA